MSASHDATIRVWDISGLYNSNLDYRNDSDTCGTSNESSPKIIGTLEGHALTVWGLIIDTTSESNRLWSGSADGFVFVRQKYR